MVLPAVTSSVPFLPFSQEIDSHCKVSLTVNFASNTRARAKWISTLFSPKFSEEIKSINRAQFFLGDAALEMSSVV